MKKYLSVLLIIVLLLTVGISGFADNEPPVPTPDDPAETSAPVEPSPSAEATSSPEVTAAPSPTPASVYPVITKHPTDENIYSGGRAVFIARADNATSITWYLISPDGSSTILASSIPALFQGISVSGCDSEKLVITGATTKISGYRAFARFGNSNGFTDSNAATVTVTIDPNPSPSPVVTPVPTTAPLPTSEPTPLPTIPLVNTPEPVQTPSVTPRPSAEPSTHTSARRSLGFGTVLLLALCTLVIVGAGIILTMYVKGTIDLSWLEDAFTRKENTSRKSSKHISMPDEEDLDIPEQFYDPDDYKK